MGTCAFLKRGMAKKKEPQNNNNNNKVNYHWPWIGGPIRSLRAGDQYVVYYYTQLVVRRRHRHQRHHRRLGDRDASKVAGLGITLFAVIFRVQHFISCLLARTLFFEREPDDDDHSLLHLFNFAHPFFSREIPIRFCAKWTVSSWNLKGAIWKIWKRAEPFFFCPC